MSTIELKINDTVPTSRVYYHSQIPGGYLRSPRSYYKSLKFVVDHFYDYIPELRKIRIPEKTPLCDVDIARIDDIVSNYLKEQFSKSCSVLFPTDTDPGKIVMSSQEDEFTIYVVGMSFLPYLKKRCKKAEQVIMDCIRILINKEVPVWENYFVDQRLDFLIERVEESKETESIHDDYSDDFVITYNTEMKTAKHIEKYANRINTWLPLDLLYSNLEKSKKSFDKLPLNPVFKSEIDELVKLIFEIRDSKGLETITELSKEMFMKENGISHEDEMDVEGYIPSFSDLFLIHWYHNELTADDMAMYISEHTGNFGYITGYVETELSEKEDIGKTIEKLINKYSLIFKLPEIFTAYQKLEEKIRNYITETNHGKQTELQFCNKDLRD